MSFADGAVIFGVSMYLGGYVTQFWLALKEKDNKRINEGEEASEL